MNEYLELQSVVKNGMVVSDVHEKDNQIFFKLSGYQFATFGSIVYHESYPGFQHAAIKALAARRNDPVVIAQEQEDIEQWDKEYELWEKHKEKIVFAIIIQAMEDYRKGGAQLMIKTLENYLDISPNGDACKDFLEMCEAADL